MICYPELSRAGRLGNQMWEIASTIGLARKHNDEPCFPEWDYAPYFQVPEEMFGECTGTLATSLVPYMDERARTYLQDYSLFRDVEDEIRSYFRPSQLARKAMENHYAVVNLRRPIISLHVRRGDNVTHPEGFHPLRSMEYYRAALEWVGDGSLAVFSDDIPWCIEHLEKGIDRKVDFFYQGVARPREYVDRVKYEDAPVLDWIDVQLMSLCDKHIISNSTYAWWGAFLSSNPNPVYPSNWFGRHIRDWTDASLMFPEDWVEIHDPTRGGV